MKKSKVVSAEKEMPKVPKEAMAAKEDSAEDKKEDAEEMLRQGKWDLDSILAAEEIKGDEKRMKYVMKAMETKEKGFRSIQELKDAYKAKYEKNNAG